MEKRIQIIKDLLFIIQNKTKYKCRFEIDCLDISMTMISFNYTQGKPVQKNIKLKNYKFCFIAPLL